MKGLNKVFLFVVVLIFSIALYSCSGSSNTHKYNAKRGQTTIDPVSSKGSPVGKKFILKSKRKPILGQKKPI